MRSSTLAIASPCHESWEAMEGEGARRFCGVCQKHVHDLSALAQAEASALLREQAGQSLCVRYTAEADGTLRFRDLVPRASLTRKLVRTTLAAAALAACTPHAEPPTRGLGDTIVEAIQRDTVPTADGGCDYTTGPFTTFHLPPGHVLCGPAGSAGPEPAWPTVMGAMPPAPEPPAPEPVVEVAEPPRPLRMGQAIVMPEPVDPFVPCDPPPVVREPKPAVEREMGRVAPKVAPRPDPRPEARPVKGGIKLRERRPADDEP